MDLRQTLYDTAAPHALGAAATSQLEAWAGLHDAPPAAARRVAQGLAVSAAALLGLGLVFWVAAHWDTLGRFGRLALLQAAVVVLGLGAWWRPAARLPLALALVLATGALLAFIGQTYQTGADPWQLFALWALLVLPLCLGLRSDVLWAPWALIAMTAAALWVQTHTGHGWRAQPHDLAAHAMGWLLALLLVAGLSPPLQRHTGAGPWALRTALVLTVVSVSASALGGLFQQQVAAHYAAGLLVLVLLAAALLPRSTFDVFGLSAAALGLNTLLVAGLGRWLFDSARDSDSADPIGRLLLLGLVAALLLAGTVSQVLRLARERAAAGEAA
jgi:uncharacterized membrane protein